VRSSYEPVENEIEQFVDILATVVAGDLFMQMPPDPFDRVGLWSIGGQKMQNAAVPPLGQVLLDLLATVRLMEDGIVADYVNAAVTTKASSQFVQVSQEEIGIAARTRLTEDDFACPPVQRSGQVPLGVGAGRDDFGLLASSHPHRTDLGVGVHVHLV